MLIVFTVNHKDAQLGLKQAQWLASLGPQMHDAILAMNRRAKANDFDVPIIRVMEGCFQSVELFVPYDEEETENANGMPHSRPANHLFKRVVQHVKNFKSNQPFIWMETDAVLLVRDGFDQIAAEYAICNKAFMGDFVNIKDVTPHMSGIAVYHDIPLHCPNYALLDVLAFDVALAPEILPNCHQTRLIQHEWKPEPFASMDDLKRLRKGAVIYHQDKTGSLVDLLQGKEPEVPVVAAKESAKLQPEPARTWIDEIRGRVHFLRDQSRASLNNRKRIMDELSKAMLVPGGSKATARKPALAK